MRSFIFGFTLLSLFFTVVDAQLVNGQFFTRGLAISNAPAPDSEHTVGGTIGVSVDVSGNGRLPEDSWGPNTELPSGFISLSLFLISDNYNLTIIDGSTGEFLAGEPGSTVKHLNYVIPDCLAQGQYQYTYYEVSRMNDTEYFAITPIDITIRNPSNPNGGTCDSTITNPIQPRPQSDFAVAVNPFTGGSTLNTSRASPQTNTAMPPTYTQPQTRQAEKPRPTTGLTHDAQAAYDVSLLYPIRRGFSSSARRSLSLPLSLSSSPSPSDHTLSMGPGSVGRLGGIVSLSLFGGPLLFAFSLLFVG